MISLIFLCHILFLILLYGLWLALCGWQWFLQTIQNCLWFELETLKEADYFLLSKFIKISSKVEVSPWLFLEDITMKPTAVADEMFPEGAGTYVDAEEGGGSVGLLMDLSAVNEKAVHDGFFNDFEDLFDDEDIA